MRNALLTAIPLLPFVASVALWLNVFFGQPLAEKGVRRLTALSLALSFALSAWVFAGQLADPSSEVLVVARWLYSGDYRVDLELLIDPLSSSMMLLSTGFGLLVARFSKNYMHRESGFCRFHAVLSLFIAAMLLLVMGGNLVLTFAGWEGVGLCSYLLIGYYYDRSGPASAGTRAFITNRIGDAGFLTAIFVAFAQLGAIDHRTLAERVAAADPGTATVIALGLLVAAAGKSAQLPFSPWLARAMEGPTPSSALFYAAVMVNAGLYLVIRSYAIFDAAPSVLHVMAAVGAATALYGGISSLAQTDVKGGLISSTSGQIGLMFVACGLGHRTLALVHLAAHALLRCYQFLTAPSVLLRMRPGVSLRGAAPQRAWLVPIAVCALAVAVTTASVGGAVRGFLAPAAKDSPHAATLASALAFFMIGLAIVTAWSVIAYLRRARPERMSITQLDEAHASTRAPGFELRRVHAMALHRFWLDELYARWIVRPVLALGRALERFDAEVIDRAAGRPLPVRRAPSGAPAGALGQLVGWLSSAVNSVEEHVVSRAIGRGIPVTGKLLGRALNHVDEVLSQPLVAGVLLVVCLVAAIRGVL